MTARRRAAAAAVVIGLIGGLGWLAVVAGRDEPPGATSTIAAPSRATAAAPAQLAAARAEARKRQPAPVIALPANPPPVGLPAWATQLPGQRDPGMPTPRGAR